MIKKRADTSFNNVSCDWQQSASLAKWLRVRLPTKWLWVWILLLSLKLQILCLKQGVPWHSDNYRVQIHCVTYMWYDNNMMTSCDFFLLIAVYFQLRLPKLRLYSSTNFYLNIFTDIVTYFYLVITTAQLHSSKPACGML